MSFVDMAERLGVAEATVRRKYYRLVNAGVIRVTAVTDPSALGFRTPAMIGLKVRPRQLDVILERLRQMPNVRYVAATTGEYDLIIEGVFRDNQELSSFVLHDLGRLDGIIDTNTSLLLRIFKDNGQLPVDAPRG